MKHLRWKVVLALFVAALVAPLGVRSQEQTANWFLVRFVDRIDGSDHTALEEAGARAIQYRPHNSYQAWLDTDARLRAEHIATVESVRSLSPSERIDPSLLNTSVDLLVEVITIADPGGPIATRLSALGRVAATYPADPQGETRSFTIYLQPNMIQRMASIPEVLYIGPAPTGLHPEDEASDQILAANFIGNTPTVGYKAWLESVGLSGQGVRVSVVDSGVDARHPDLSGRVATRVEYSGPLEEALLDSYGHGTHVAGIIAGAGLGSALGGRDSAGFHVGLGIAPAAELVDQNAISTTAPFPPSGGFPRLSRDAVTRGSVAWNASWHTGEGTGIGYIQSARTMDIIVRDANWSVADVAEPFILVFSAGNAGPDSTTMTAPKEAKNMITVASSRSHRAGNINTISSFSSRGPARDGRTLPTVAAPGQSIVSTRSSAGLAACNLPFSATLPLYASCSGTSMAAPHVTGAVALITQWWKNNNSGASPTPAMAKALLINSATDMLTADIPNKHEGWGRVNLAALFDSTASRIYKDQDVVFTNLDDSHTIKVTVADPNKPLKVSLVWTDAPGAAGAIPALVNDLDLRVTSVADSQVFLGNVFASGFSKTGGLADRLNNLENVFIKSPIGTYDIRISAFNLPGDGVPFSGDATDQDFALIISNATIAP